MRSLVTGASGFVGTALSRLLLERGDVVTGTFRARSAPAGVIPVHLEDLDGADWRDIVAGHDTVYHLAARVHVMSGERGDAESAYQRTNVDATVELARASAAAGVRHLVFLSSVKAAAETSGAMPLRESDAPEPRDAYGRSKLHAEKALEALRASSGMRISILRPPLVYGRGVGANFLRLMKAVDRGIPLPLGRVSNRRSIVFVGNLVDAAVRCVDAGAAASGTFYVADAASISTPELLRAMGEALGRAPRVLNVPLRMLEIAGAIAHQSDVIQRLSESLEVDTARITRELAWTPPFTTCEGLSVTADWMRGQS